MYHVIDTIISDVIFKLHMLRIRVFILVILLLFFFDEINVMHSAHTHTHLWWWWSCYCVYVKEIMKCEQTHDRRGEWERTQERRISEGKLCINKGKSGSIHPLETMLLELLYKQVALKTYQSCCSYRIMYLISFRFEMKSNERRLFRLYLTLHGNEKKRKE